MSVAARSEARRRHGARPAAAPHAGGCARRRRFVRSEVVADSRGRRDVRRGQAAWRFDQVDRGSPREPHDVGSRSRRCTRCRGRSARRRDDPGTACRHHTGPGRLSDDAVVVDDHRPHGATLPGPYRIPAYQATESVVFTNKSSNSALRGPWAAETLVRERLLDHVARRLGISPVQVRRRNLVPLHEA